MLKQDIANELRTLFPEHLKKDISAVVELTFEAMTKALEDGRRIEIRGFGSFALHKQKGREFINPKTGSLTKCPPNYRIVFKPGKDLKTVDDV